jgi:hypothetical protein
LRDSGVFLGRALRRKVSADPAISCVVELATKAEPPTAIAKLLPMVIMSSASASRITRHIENGMCGFVQQGRE